MAVYLDCSATTRVDPRVQREVILFFSEEFGNAGSRTHEFGTRAKQAVQRAREQVASVAAAKSDEVIFTSGATESNNLALLGLASYGDRSERRHIISTQIEHKAILEPLEVLAERGFSVTLVPPNASGWVDPDTVKLALRKDTLLVSVMQVNNETGVVQPISEIARMLEGHPAYLHVDAAQGFGKDLNPLCNPRIDLISASGHKLFAPKGVGALISRRRDFDRAPLTPLLFGGGQERGLRPGTLPVPLIVGFGLAAELAVREAPERAASCRAYRNQMLAALAPLEPHFNGDHARTLPHVVNLTFPGLDSEAVMLALKDVVAISNGSACTSLSYRPSHVLQAMNLPQDMIQGALRLSWCHDTQGPDWDQVADIIRMLL